jgi:hypothetical protein
MDFRATATTELNGLVDRLATAADAAAKAALERAAAEGKIALDAVKAERTAALDAVKAERNELERTLRDETRARQVLEQANVALEEARAASEEERDTLRALNDATRQEFEDTRRDLQTKLDEALLSAADASNDAREWRIEQGRAMRDQAIAFASQSLDHLLGLTARFADVSNEDDVLSAIVAALSTEFSRVALFRISNNRLEAIRHVGFDFPDDPTHLVIPQVVDALIDRVVTSGQVETLPTEVLAEMAGTPFGGSAACALALPIDLDGDACAVAYADDADHPHQAFANAELRRKFALLLRQIAAPLLLRLPAEEKAVTELREYAARLVTELENLYDADVATHKKPADLRRRLQENLECARDIYAQRVASEPAAAATLLEDQLSAAINRTRTTPYGRDLAAIAGSVFMGHALRTRGSR